MKKYKVAIMIFRRDLRLQDNTALIAANEISEQIIPIFIYDKRQIESQNSFRSMNAIQFMHESLQELNTELKKYNSRLNLFYGITHEVVQDLLKQNVDIEAIFFNADYTPFSIERDKKISKVAEKAGCAIHISHDLTLIEPGKLLTNSKTVYKVFSSFLKAARKIKIAEPDKSRKFNLSKQSLLSKYKIQSTPKDITSYQNKNLFVTGGRIAAEMLLKRAKNLTEYSKKHDFPAEDYTSHLSAYLKFGVLSVREVYYALQKIQGIIDQLYWRDFYTHLAWQYPFVYRQSYNERYRELNWSNSTKNFRSWCAGKTGFPIIDAGMRQLNSTGYMHNRVRMIAASFLTKNLWQNWQQGEKYFAQNLVDYDPAINNCNWQWIASTGAHAQPYFRIFNPWLQQKKFDANAEYIKKWIPELKNVPAKDIHNWHTSNKKYSINYPEPIVDFKSTSEYAKKKYVIA